MGDSFKTRIANAITEYLADLHEAIKTSQTAITTKMKELGIEAFASPVTNTWQESVEKILLKKTKVISKKLEALIENEIMNATPIDELQEKLEMLASQLRAREEELNRLYNLTEGDPKYQAYHVLRDLSPNWVDITQVGRSLGIPAVRAKRLLKEFVAIGLVEIDGKRARTLQPIRKADTTYSKTKEKV